MILWKKGVKNQKFSNTGFRIYLCSYFYCCFLFLHLPSSVLVLIPENFSSTVINRSSREKTLNFCLPGNDLIFSSNLEDNFFIPLLIAAAAAAAMSLQSCPTP